MSMTLSEQELHELYMRYGPILHHRARHILGSEEDAHDAVQETFARVWRHHESFRQAASPLTWMYQINTNWCLNKLRDRKGHARKHTDHREEIAGEVVTQPGDEVDAGVVRHLMAESDEETRRIVIHLFFDDMTREETAAMVGISQPTLRKRLDAFLMRARRKLGVPLAVAGLVVWLSWWVQP